MSRAITEKDITQVVKEMMSPSFREKKYRIVVGSEQEKSEMIEMWWEAYGMDLEDKHEFVIITPLKRLWLNIIFALRIDVLIHKLNILLHKLFNE